MIGVAAPMVTAGGGPLTTTLPVRAGWRASWYLNVPAVLNVRVHVRPAAIVGEAKAPLLATTWCAFVSLFVHLIASPVLIVMLAGLKAVAVMLTALVAVAAGRAAPATTSVRALTAMSTRLRISMNPLVDGGY